MLWCYSHRCSKALSSSKGEFIFGHHLVNLENFASWMTVDRRSKDTLHKVNSDQPSEFNVSSACFSNTMEPTVLDSLLWLMHACDYSWSLHDHFFLFRTVCTVSHPWKLWKALHLESAKIQSNKVFPIWLYSIGKLVVLTRTTSLFEVHWPAHTWSRSGIEHKI